ncbi:MAG: thioredoxin family protein [Gammaproteobacteria bacterium]|nr:thioredoxin family protein [Gammaproteobacteria bacterium]
MSLTESTMLELGTKAPDFSLPNTNAAAGKKIVSLKDFDNTSAILIAFICNHCPYVVHIREGFVKFTREYQDKNLAVIAISANDVTTHPQDGPEYMQADAEKYDYTFPYLYDETQDIAKTYNAACTPDFFLFDNNRELAYRGQFDSSRPNSGVPVTGEDLRAATDAVLSGQAVAQNQIPSVGCNIKWKQDG